MIINKNNLLIFCWLLLNLFFTALPQNTSESAQSGKFDLGKMWTFENPPLDFFEEEYNFRPDEEWLTKTRMSALRLSSGCSASFVSADGLIMTNHHCVRGLLPLIDKNEENFLRDGFYADSLTTERKIPGLYVEQLVIIEDVSDEILSEIAKGKTDQEKLTFKDEAIQNILIRMNAKDDSLNYVVTPLYNGGKFSLYGYRRYDDLRLVFVPDLRTAKLGGDYDNFTYPRHGLDCAFLRAYENDIPVTTENYFSWSLNGAAAEEPIFVIGNPGTTERIKTTAQIMYDRDIHYPPLVNLLQKIYDIRLAEVMRTNAEDFELIAKLYSIGNALKVYQGTLKGLRDPWLIARKSDFEKEFRRNIDSDSGLKTRYAHIWEELKEIKTEAAKYYPEFLAYNINPAFSSAYSLMARDIIRFANEMKLPEEQRNKNRIEDLELKIFSYKVDRKVEQAILAANIDFYYERLGEENDLLRELTGGRRGNEAAEYILNNSVLVSEEAVDELMDKSADEILNTEDPLLTFTEKAQMRLTVLRENISGIEKREAINKQLLGEALFTVYGESIPPDATFTLRIADGVIKSYPYNGTIAPPYTTFFGVLEKYHSFGKQFPFNLHPMWENLPDAFDLSTPLNFISTNDIIGGNSGSAIINIEGKIVGLAFDGNYESLPGRYIFTTEANRTVSVHSSGIIEAVKDLYNAEALADELLTGGRIKK